jgi:hypothetical protein
MFGDPSSEPLPSPQALARAQLALLGELATIGLELAQDLRADVKGQVRSTARERAALESPDDAFIPLAPLPVFAGDVGLIYARISRAVRLTLALQTRILRALARPDQPDVPAADWSKSAPASRSGRQALEDGSRERLTDPDDVALLAELPFEDAVAIIRRDLGLVAGQAAHSPAAEAAKAEINGADPHPALAAPPSRPSRLPDQPSPPPNPP